MSTLIAAFIFIAVTITIMAVGVIFGRVPIKGTCGGLNQMMGNEQCSFCAGDAKKCGNHDSQSLS